MYVIGVKATKYNEFIDFWKYYLSYFDYILRLAKVYRWFVIRYFFKLIFLFNHENEVKKSRRFQLINY